MKIYIVAGPNGERPSTPFSNYNKRFEYINISERVYPDIEFCVYEFESESIKIGIKKRLIKIRKGNPIHENIAKSLNNLINGYEFRYDN